MFAQMLPVFKISILIGTELNIFDNPTIQQWKFQSLPLKSLEIKIVFWGVLVAICLYFIYELSASKQQRKSHLKDIGNQNYQFLNVA